MRHFSGRGGDLYALGEPYRFHDLPLEDCGDGWDWRAPEGLRFWLQGGGLSFEVFDGVGWTSVGAVDVYHRSGRVALDRCARGMAVRASGICLPISIISSGDSWELDVPIFTRPKPGLGSDGYDYESIRGEARALIKGAPLPPIELVMALLPSGAGAFIGLGKPESDANGTVVQFDQEGVAYVHR